ncbi:Non-specific lipid transfer protein GPI-anchored 21 [Linum perenne]
MASPNNMLLLLLSIIMVLQQQMVSGQIPTSPSTTTACSATAIAGLSPCMSFLTNNNGSTPTSDCCTSLKNLTSTSTDCLCLAINGSPLPFQIPNINRTLAISLPRACNMPGVPLQCKAAATGAPAPAPAPGQAASLAPSLAPGVSQSADSPQGSAVPVPETPSEGSTPAALNPPSTSTNTSPSASAAATSYPSSPSLFLFLLGFILFYFN